MWGDAATARARRSLKKGRKEDLDQEKNAHSTKSRNQPATAIWVAYKGQRRGDREWEKGDSKNFSEQGKKKRKSADWILISVWGKRKWGEASGF